MHALTSVIFVPSFIETLSPQFWTTLLDSHFRVMIAYWIARGRPRLYIKEYLMKATESPEPPSQSARGEALALHKETRQRGLKDVSEETKGRDGVNPWSDIYSSAIDHPDEHVTKVIRSLAFAAQQFGRRPKGYLTSTLDGVSELDGTVFIRAAGMTLDTMGWCHFGQEPAKDWDRSKPGYDQAWHNAPKL
ncbi:hypothetical protein ACM66B_003208 [Microbotryomycetes sp. NB124-2]